MISEQPEQENENSQEVIVMRCYGNFYKDTEQLKKKDFLTRLDNAVYHPETSN